MTTTTLTQRIRSPEDIKVGDYVVKSYTHYQLVPGGLEPSIAGQTVEPITLTGWSSGAGEPEKVLAVSLPFVLVECCTYGLRHVIDTRQHVLMKVGKAYADAAKPEPEKKKKKEGQRQEAEGSQEAKEEVGRQRTPRGLISRGVDFCFGTCGVAGDAERPVQIVSGASNGTLRVARYTALLEVRSLAARRQSACRPAGRRACPSPGSA
ncbi:MAG: hypothetical protein AAF711_17235 [Planctomycetota bacterium]